MLLELLGDRRLRITNARCRRLAVKGRAIGRRTLEQLAGLVTPDTLLRGYRELIAEKYNLDLGYTRTTPWPDLTECPRRDVINQAAKFSHHGNRTGSQRV